jgi:hypothetical protein
MAKRYTLREIFSNVHGTSFVGLDTETVVKLKGGKKNEQQGRVTKKTIGSQVMVFSNTGQNGYENMVKRRLVEEGKDPESFKLGERAWGTRVPNLPIIEHEKDGVVKEYLEAIFQKAGKSEYFLDGMPINKEDIEGLDAIDSVEPLVPTGQGGLDEKVVLRTFSADSLLNVRVDGVEYQFK